MEKFHKFMLLFRKLNSYLRITCILMGLWYNKDRYLDKYLNIRKGDFMNDVFKALSDPTRREILEMLSHKDLSAGEIADAFNITKPSISNHLTILKNAKMITSNRQGQNIIYSLNTTVFHDVVKWIYSIRKEENEHEKD